LDKQSIHECNCKLYRSGLLVVYKGKRAGRKKEELNRISKLERTYSINRTKVRSASLAAWQAKTSKYMLFITFTFPFEPSEEQAAKIWNNLLTNLRNHYEIKNYVWVKECQNSGRIHYHIIVDANRIDIKRLQNTWNRCINHINPDCDCGSNSVRLGNRPIIYNIKAISKYLSKYISKSDTRKAIFNRKAYGFSDSFILAKAITTETADELAEMFGIRLLCDGGFYELYVYGFDYFSWNFEGG
jgi:hypothetical protein